MTSLGVSSVPHSSQNRLEWATRNACEHLSSDSDSGEEKDHGDCEKGDPHPMKEIPLSEFALRAFRESIRTQSDHAVVDWHQGQ